TLSLLVMERRTRPEYVLEVLADPTCVKDIVRGASEPTGIESLQDSGAANTIIGILHTIFFHRYFPSMRPSSLEVLDLTLPVVADPELETLIETRVGQLVRQLSSTSSLSGGSRGELGVRFFEKRRRKATGLGGWLTGTGRSEEEVCWEVWKLKITLTTPRTESGGNYTLEGDQIRVTHEPDAFLHGKACNLADHTANGIVHRRASSTFRQISGIYCTAAVTRHAFYETKLNYNRSPASRIVEHC
ncbi:MAG: hypothetical protein Q9173_003181, partial [Seirophora scorigena]